MRSREKTFRAGHTHWPAPALLGGRARATQSLPKSGRDTFPNHTAPLRRAGQRRPGIGRAKDGVAMPSKPSTEIVAHDGAAPACRKIMKKPKKLSPCATASTSARNGPTRPRRSQATRGRRTIRSFISTRSAFARGRSAGKANCCWLDGRGGDRSETGSPPTFAVSRARAR